MENLVVRVPVSGLNPPSKWGTRGYVKSVVENVWSKYSDLIKNASKNSGIPESIITSVISIESEGNSSASTSDIHTGLMQWNRNYAKKQLEDELKQKRMTNGEADILKKYGIMDAKGNIRAVTKKDQLIPEVNITIGAILLGQLIDTKWGKSDGKLHLDRVIAVYNAGAYGDTGQKARQVTKIKYDTAEKLAPAINLGTRAYLSKLLASNGALDVATSDFKGIINA